MKKLIISLLFVLVSFLVYSQATPSSQVRVANATTAFGINVAVGTTVYDVSSDKYYVCKTGSASTLTLTTGSANFTLLGGTGAYMTALGMLKEGTLIGSRTKIDLQDSTGMAVTVTDDPTNNRVKYSFRNTAPDQTVSIANGTGMSVTGTYPNFTATNSAPDQTVSIANGTGMSVTGTYPNFTATNSAPDQVVSITNGGGIVATGTYPNFTLTATAKTAIVEDFEQATDSIANNRCYFQLTQTPAAGTISVIVNGMNLKPTTQYAIISNKLRIGFAVYQYDKVQISYSY
ncbi:MAG: hypothetical protein WCO63_01355 [Bacteroidota bacterium]